MRASGGAHGLSVSFSGRSPRREGTRKEGLHKKLSTFQSAAPWGDSAGGLHCLNVHTPWDGWEQFFAPSQLTGVNLGKGSKHRPLFYDDGYTEQSQGMIVCTYVCTISTSRSFAFRHHARGAGLGRRRIVARLPRLRSARGRCLVVSCSPFYVRWFNYLDSMRC